MGSGNFMLAGTGHLFDDATGISAGDSRWQGRTSDDYWAFVGPFGGATAPVMVAPAGQISASRAVRADPALAEGRGGVGQAV
jgi:hypothetical protein